MDVCRGTVDWSPGIITRLSCKCIQIPKSRLFGVTLGMFGSIYIQVHGNLEEVSGLTGLELRAAHDWLKKLKQSLIPVNDADVHPSDVSQSPATIDSDFEETLDTMITMMESKLNGPQV